ncbi:RbsK Sugar kinases, ribokinase family [Fimbriimonadaceae bacterium]
MKKILVAGHICLDIIPKLHRMDPFIPGSLVEVGSATLSTGGAVSNVGRALHRLGVPMTMVGLIGTDVFGQNVQSLLGPLASCFQVREDVSTSYSIVLDPPGQDRMFMHYPGANADFSSATVTDYALSLVDHLHFGYPPLMRSMIERDGAELTDLFRRAKAAGLSTSLDLSVPDTESLAGQVDWPGILRSVLPFVDDFMPSQDDLSVMFATVNPVHTVAKAHELGASRVVLKCGEDGVLLSDENGAVWQRCFPVQVVGATGAGDATIAGYLYGKFHGKTPAESIRLGCAVGAFCCESADAVSGIPTSAELHARLEGEWRADVSAGI